MIVCNLRITLDKLYKGGENYTIYLNYVSRPNQLKVKGSAAITDAKGLYFINPKGEEEISPLKYGHKEKRKQTAPGFQLLTSRIRKQRKKFT